MIGAPCHFRVTLNKADDQHQLLQSKDIFDVMEIEKFVFCSNSIVYLLYTMLQAVLSYVCASAAFLHPFLPPEGTKYQEEVIPSFQNIAGHCAYLRAI